MNPNPLFSIVIANYNHGQFIEEAIESILNQSCQDFELIIVDGGSTDNSMEIIEKYANKLSWWVSEKDKGQSDAFNKGFAKAHGEFYFWLNADDLLLPNSLERAKIMIEKNPNILWFAANTIFFSKNGTIMKCARGPEWNDYLIKNSQIYVYGPSSIFHNTIFEEAGRFNKDLYFSMDTDLWIRFYKNGVKFKRIKKYFWGFRIHEKSKTSHTFSTKPAIEYLKEGQYILKANNISYTYLGKLKQTIYKVLSGCYLYSYIDSLKLKGKKISNINL